MLEPVHDQAAGLLAWNLQPPNRVLAVAASERGSASLELLWRLRQGCDALGLVAVVVEGAPGLWADGPDAGGVWLWHTPAEVVMRWWPPDGGRPLVALSAEPAALVAAYRALKVLRQGGLRPVVVALPDDAANGPEAPGASPVAGPLEAALAALQRTCVAHLNWVPTVWRLGYHARGLAEPEGEAALCKVLDAAWTLDAPGMAGGGLRPC